MKQKAKSFFKVMTLCALVTGAVYSGVAATDYSHQPSAQHGVVSD